MVFFATLLYRRRRSSTADPARPSGNGLFSRWYEMSNLKPAIPGVWRPVFRTQWSLPTQQDSNASTVIGLAKGYMHPPFAEKTDNITDRRTKPILSKLPTGNEG